jgi:hypothetical protein
VGVAIGWDGILVPSNHIILVTGENKYWDSLAIAMITQRIPFTDDNASRDSADQGNIASQENTGTASGVVNPIFNRTKQPNSLGNNFTSLKIQRES